MQRKKGVALSIVACASCFFSFIAPAHANLSADVMELSAQCAPSVHPSTMAYIVSHESNNNPFAIGINDGERLATQPTDRDSAIAIAERLHADGRSFDSGYGQVHSGNLPGLGLSVGDLFDPCTNLRASAVILEGCFERAAGGEGGSPDSQAALRAALSCYNTNSMTRGFDNGYVEKVTRQLAYTVPELLPSGQGGFSQPVRVQAAEPSQSPPPIQEKGGDVFDARRGGAFSPNEKQDQVSSTPDDISNHSASTFFESVQLTSDSD